MRKHFEIPRFQIVSSIKFQIFHTHYYLVNLRYIEKMSRKRIYNDTLDLKFHWFSIEFLPVF